jgi:hypothetical protein
MLCSFLTETWMLGKCEPETSTTPLSSPLFDCFYAHFLVVQILRQGQLRQGDFNMSAKPARRRAVAQLEKLYP